MTTPIDPPTLTLDVDDLVDWLELTAFFDSFGVARFNSLVGSLLELEETPLDDIGEGDRKREQLLDGLENEIRERNRTLGEVYPFEIPENGEELHLKKNWCDVKFTFYLICLITTHVTGSSILRTPPVDDLLRRLRNRIFQIVATLGLAGHSSGPAFSVGWPREAGETIVQLLDRAVAAGGAFTVRKPPGIYTSPHEKDGGIDVIAWKDESIPPPTTFYFGQTASGKNWPSKPVTDHARVFSGAYMLDHATLNHNYVTLIPYRVLDADFFKAQSQFHWSILERLRLPLRAWQGLQLAEQGIPVDHADHLSDLTQWLAEFINYAQTV